MGGSAWQWQCVAVRGSGLGAEWARAPARRPPEPGSQLGPNRSREARSPGGGGGGLVGKLI
jgi:hypothetical protein